MLKALTRPRHPSDFWGKVYNPCQPKPSDKKQKQNHILKTKPEEPLDPVPCLRLGKRFSPLVAARTVLPLPASPLPGGRGSSYFRNEGAGRGKVSEACRLLASLKRNYHTTRGK